MQRNCKKALSNFSNCYEAFTYYHKIYLQIFNHQLRQTLYFCKKEIFISNIKLFTIMKNFKLVYWISTGLLTALTLMSAGMYIFNHEAIKTVFANLGYPTYIIYPLAVAKLLGLIAIWTNQSRSLKEWAYAGFFFDFILAFLAHYMIGDGEFAPALVAIVLLFTSYFSWKKLAV